MIPSLLPFIKSIRHLMRIEIESKEVLPFDEEENNFSLFPIHFKFNQNREVISYRSNQIVERHEDEKRHLFV